MELRKIKIKYRNRSKREIIREKIKREQEKW